MPTKHFFKTQFCGPPGLKVEMKQADNEIIMGAFTNIIKRRNRNCRGHLCAASLNAQSPAPRFNVVAFYTGRSDLAHISFLHEANRWFPQMYTKYTFSYEATTNWNQLNAEFLSRFQVVLFLDTRPEAPAQRKAF